MVRKQTAPYYVVLSILLICAACKYKTKPPNTDLVLHGNPEIKNKAARAIFEEGLHFIELGDYGSARKRFFDANRACPDNPFILNAIGGTFSQTGSPDKGNTYFERALKLDSNYLITYANLGGSLNLTMRYEEAKQIFHLGLIRPTHDSLSRSSLFLNLANTYFLNKEYDSALVFLDSAKAHSGHSRIYGLALEAQAAINRKFPIPVKK